MITLQGTARVELEIKRSRFVAHCARVKSMADTLAFYESVIDPGATHNCWAWRLERQYRFNDDGEPGGTAGKPILAAIDGKKLDQAMVIVTRYYGGTKLGVGGLVRAYSGAASRSLDEAGVIEIHPTMSCRINLPFDSTGQVHQLLETLQAQKVSESFENQGPVLQIIILQDQYERLKSMLRDVSRGKASVTRLEDN